MGVYDEAIEHLNRAQELMALMPINDPLGRPLTLADISGQMFVFAVSSIERMKEAAEAGYGPHTFTLDPATEPQVTSAP